RVATAPKTRNLKRTISGSLPNTSCCQTSSSAWRAGIIPTPEKSRTHSRSPAQRRPCRVGRLDSDCVTATGGSPARSMAARFGRITRGNRTSGRSSFTSTRTATGGLPDWPWACNSRHIHVSAAFQLFSEVGQRRGPLLRQCVPWLRRNSLSGGGYPEHELRAAESVSVDQRQWPGLHSLQYHHSPARFRREDRLLLFLRCLVRQMPIRRRSDVFRYPALV